MKSEASAERRILNEFRKRAPKSRKYYERALRVIPSGTHRGVIFYRPYPVYSRFAKGSKIVDIDGKERIDYCFNYSSLILGHRNRKVIAAIEAEVENGLGRGQPTTYEVDLAERVSNIFSAAEMVKFTVTGTEACMNAIRAARAYTNRKKIIMFEGAYHGSSDSVSVKGLAFQSQGVPQEIQGNSLVIPFDDPEALEKAINANNGEVAAVLMEPFLAAGGMIVPSLDFSKHVREITEKKDVLFVLDEIVSGFRISRGGWQEKFRIKPDIMTLGKNLTGGMPGGAVAGKEDIMKDVYHHSENIDAPKVPLSGTFNAHPISMVAGIATLDQLSPDIYEKIDSSSHELMNGFIRIARDLGVNAKAPRIGSVFQFYFSNKEMRDTRSVRGANRRLRWCFDLAMLNRGVYLSPGHFCCTSTATSLTDVKKTLDMIETVLQSNLTLFKAQ